MTALIGLDSTSSGFDPGLQVPPKTFGVWGDSGDADGVIGSSNTGVGVFGRSIAAAAVKGSSENGTGVDATSTTGSALHARRDPGGGAAVTEAFLATPDLAADFRGDVATSGAVRVGGRLGIGIGAQTEPAAKLHVNGAEEGIRVQGPATGNANVAYISFVDSAGTRIGYVGDASTGTANVYLRSDLGDVALNTAAGRVLTATSNGNVGIGTTAPKARLEVNGAEEGIRVQGPARGNANVAYISFVDSAGTRMGYVGDASSDNASVYLRSYLGDVALNTEAGRVLTATSNGNVGIGMTAPRARLEVNGNIRAANIGLTNADCAEDFDIGETEQAEPGTVMVVGEEGVLYPSQQAYDKRVAGVISGAGDYQPGIVLNKQQSSNARKPIALFGKVYCKVSAQYGVIEVGDLLTTSPTPGHAMKADDPLKAFGTVIGKALRSLKEGRGLIPILIALQ